MKQLTIKDGQVYLDEEKVENLKSYNVRSSTTDKGIAELTLIVDVSTVRVES